MTTTATQRPTAGRYALGHTPAEYERLRAQARMWDAATGRLLDQVGLGPGASCLNAGCGPGETMRAMAGGSGPRAACSASTPTPRSAVWRWRCCTATGYRHCAFHAQDLTAGDPIPGAPYNLVYTRLLLFHLPSASTCWPGCGRPSPWAVTCSSRTSTCAVSAACLSWTAWPTGCGWSPTPSARRARTCRPAPGCRSCSPRPASGLPTAPTSRATSCRSPPHRRSSSRSSAACCRRPWRTASPPRTKPRRCWPRWTATSAASPIFRR